jgi:hypothetical protein
MLVTLSLPHHHHHHKQTEDVALLLQAVFCLVVLVMVQLYGPLLPRV